MKYLTGLSAMVTVLALAGCQVPLQMPSGAAESGTKSKPPEPRVTTVAAPTHCGLTAPGLVLAQSSEDLQRLASKPSAQLPQWSEKADTWLLLVSTGQKYSGGYSMALESFEWRDKTLRLNVTQNEPEENTLATQALTTPCLVLSIPKDGWESLIVAGESPFPIIRIHP